MAEHIKIPRGDVVIVLSVAEAKGLEMLASEGAEALLTDEAAARAYIGSKTAVEAAKRAHEELRRAVHNLT